MVESKQEVNGGDKKTASSEQTPTSTSATKTTDQKSKVVATKKGSGDKAAEVTQKYNKLKKRYRHLREEYSRILESWEASAKSIKSLLEERKFLKKKLETFFKSQHFIDDQVFAMATAAANKDAAKI